MPKRIEINNGEVRLGYSYDELSEEAQAKAEYDAIDFICNVEIQDDSHPLWYLAQEMEKMGTPWFLGMEIMDREKEYVLEHMNQYLYDEEGAILPIIYHTKGSEIIKTTFGRKKRECTIVDLK